MVTKEKTISFLQNTLKIEHVEIKLKADKFSLLNEILPLYHKLPFQNLTFFSQFEDEKSRRIPTMSENIESVMGKLEGGLCWTLNSTLFVILQSLGYDVYPVLASVHSPGTNNHIALIVKDLKENDDLHLIESGFGNPTFEPIPLNFTDEGIEYCFSFRKVKYVKEGDTYIRKHYHSCANDYDDSKLGDWSNEYFFSLNPCSLGDISNSIDARIYRFDTCFRFFPSTLRILKWVEEKAIIIKDFSLLLEDENNKLQTTDIKSVDELEKTIERYFSENFTSYQIKSGVQRWLKANPDMKGNKK